MVFLNEIVAERKMLMLLICLWLIPSGIAYLYGTAEVFSAFGSVGVVVAVFAIANIIKTMSWAIRTERAAQLDDRISLVSNQHTLDVISRPSATAVQRNLLPSVENEITAIKARIEHRRVTRLNERSERHESAILKFDTLILCIATLQWGFGAWIFDIFDCGVLTC